MVCPTIYCGKYSHLSWLCDCKVRDICSHVLINVKGGVGCVCVCVCVCVGVWVWGGAKLGGKMSGADHEHHVSKVLFN